MLSIPDGYYNGFVALDEGSVLMVFSDVDLETSKNDDYRIGVEVLSWEEKS